MARLIDISPLVSERIAVWPGDVAYRRGVSLSLESGDNLTLGSLASTLHLGAHADAPSHYSPGGQAIAARDLAFYYGPCQVIALSLPRGARILPSHLRQALQAPRILFKTGSFPDPQTFNEDFNSLSAPLVEAIHQAGGVLVGIDTPSVDPFADKALEAHQALARRDMANLEGLVLEHVQPGFYTLVAFPLKLAEADGSPVRAVLIEED